MTKKHYTILYWFLCKEALKTYGIFVVFLYLVMIALCGWMGSNYWMGYNKMLIGQAVAFGIWCGIELIGKLLRYLLVRFCFQLNEGVEPSAEWKRTWKIFYTIIAVACAIPIILLYVTIQYR